MVDMGNTEVCQEDGFVIWADENGAEGAFGVVFYGFVLEVETFLEVGGDFCWSGRGGAIGENGG